MIHNITIKDETTQGTYGWNHHYNLTCTCGKIWTVYSRSSIDAMAIRHRDHVINELLNIEFQINGKKLWEDK